MAKRAIKEFGSLSVLLAATPEAQARLPGTTPEMTAFLRTVRATMMHALRTDIARRPVFSSSEALIAYLNICLAGASEEQLRVLFLNARNELLRDELSFSGTTTAVALHPRPIIKRALELGATALILVHNHPSGDPTPSAEDIRATATLVAAATPLEIVVHDHIIIGSNSWTSLRSNGQIRMAA